MALDPLFSQVELLLSGGSPSVADLSSRGRALAASPTRSTAAAKFGTTSLFLGTDRILVDNTPALNFGSSDLTVELFVRQVSRTSPSPPVFRANWASGSTNGRFQLFVHEGAHALTIFNATSDGVGATISLGALPPLNTWYHLAVTRQGNVWTVWRDGVAIGTTTYAVTFPANSSYFSVGSTSDFSGYPFDGFVDEVRVTKGTARYTEAFTPPSARFATSDKGAELTLPPPLLSASASAVVVRANFAATAPAAGARAYGGASAAILGPAPTFVSYGHDATGENAFAGTVAAPTLSARGGANAAAKAPAPVLAAAGSGAGWAHAVLLAPLATVSATGSVSSTASAAIVAPAAAVIGYSGAACAIALDGVPGIQATGVSGSTGGAVLVLPLFDLAASGSAQSYGSADLLAPAPRMGATAQAWLVAPGAKLTAVGSAAVAITHEAYAVNLRSELEGGGNEVTRYTNYPFERIVRWRGSYYGMAADGLYLLEGTTDDGQPIEWVLRTGTTDFGKPEKKNTASAYVGGRLGPATTFTVLTGEKLESSYDYTTPRGATAQNYRQKFGRGLDARYYAFQLAGSGELELDDITFEVIPRTRRI